MYGMMDAYMRTFYKEQQNEEYISRYLYSSEYAIRLDSLSAQQLADYYRFITSSHQDAFRAIRMPVALSQVPISSRI